MQTNIADAYPLSPMQEGILFHTLEDPRSGMYFDQVGFPLRGRLDISALERAWQRVIDRHAILRTAFVTKKVQTPIQVVQQALKAPFTFLDWRHLSPERQRGKLDEYLVADRALGFDIEQAPLMRLTLIQLGETSFYFNWSWHHVLLDGWSSALVVAEVKICYEAFSKSAEPVMTSPRPFRDFIRWLKQQDATAAERYWRELLQGFTTATPLALQGQHSTHADVPSQAEDSLKLSADSTTRLQTVARRLRLTPNTIIQTVWGLLLGRYASTGEVVFGAVVSGRPSSLEGVESMVGLFINTLPVRIRFQPETVVSSLLRETQLQQIRSREYEYAPLVEIQKWADVSPGKPLFESILAFENFGRALSSHEAAGAGSQQGAVHVGSTRNLDQVNYPLALVVVPGRELILHVHYSPKRFAASAIARLLRHLEQMIQSICENPEREVKSVCLLTEEESRQLQLWTSPASDRIPESDVAGMIRAQAEKTPRAAALHTLDGGITYEDLLQRAQDLAQHLHSSGIGPGKSVAILMGLSAERVIACLAALLSGAAIVPFDTDDLQWCPAKIEASFCFADPDSAALAFQNGVPCLIVSPGMVNRENFLNSGSKPSPFDLSSSSIAAFEGSEKRLAVTQAELARRMLWLQRAMTIEPGDRVLHSGPFALNSLLREVLWPLAMGAAVVLDTSPRDQDGDLLDVIARGKVTVANLVASRLWALLESVQESRSLDLPVRKLLSDGEPVPPALLSRLHELGNVHCLVTYTPPETGRESAAELNDVAGRRTRICTGPALHILDRNFQPAPVETAGEIYIVVDRAELSDPQAKLRYPDNDRLIAHPLAEHQGMLYGTGDTARRREDGTIEVIDGAERAWIRGTRLDLSAIEAVLRDDPSIVDCAVRARTDAAGQRHIVCFLVARSLLSTDSLQACIQPCRSFSLAISFINIAKIPRLADGTIHEEELAALPAVNEDLAQQWEDRLRSIPGIRDAAVFVEPNVEARTPLHISDLQPFDISNNASVAQPAAAPQTPPDPPIRKSTGKLSVIHGDPILGREPQPKTVTEILLRAATEHPENGVIYVGADGREIRKTYPALLSDAERILAGMQDRGLEPGDRVIFQLDRSDDFISAFWACLFGGLVPVTCAVSQTYSPSDAATIKLQQACDMLTAAAVITSDHTASLIEALLAPSTKSCQVLTIQSLRSAVGEPRRPDQQPEDLALLLLTSGSTGKQKGVMLKHRTLLEWCAGNVQMNHFTSQDISFNWMPLDHVGASIYIQLRCVYVGCTQIQGHTQTILGDLLLWLDYLDKYRATDTWAPNFAYGMTAARIEQSVSKSRKWDLSCVRKMLNGGEAVIAQTASRFLELLAPYGLSPQVMCPGWGMSETSSETTSSKLFRPDLSSSGAAFVEVGRPQPGFSLRIVDENDELVQEPTVGRLQVKGPNVTSGYFNQPEASAASFTGDGWFNTGDLGFLRDGHLTVTGRQKEVIIVNGSNFYSHEIESVVEEFKEVSPSFTAACGVRELNGDTEKLAVFFHTDLTGAPLISLLGRIRENVARRVGLSPGYLIPVAKEVIPKTSIGKIQRAQLVEGFNSGRFADVVKQIDLSSRNTQTIPHWFFQRVWRRKDIDVRKQRPLPEICVIFKDSQGLGTELARALSSMGSRCITVESGSVFARPSRDCFRLDPSSQADCNRLFTTLAGEGTTPGHIVHMLNYAASCQGPENLDRLRETQGVSLYSLHYLLNSWRSCFGNSRVRVDAVSSHSQPILPQDPLAFERTGIIGYLQAAALELKSIECHHIDLESHKGEANLKHLIREMRDNSGEVELAYRNGLRLIPRLSAAPLKKAASKHVVFRRRGKYLITGGLGGVGMCLMEHLVREFDARLLVIGRSSLEGKSAPSRDQKADSGFSLLNRLADNVRYEAADVCDEKRLDQLIKDFVGTSELDGVIHLATTWQERYLEEPLDFEQGLGAKAFGAWTLHRLLHDRPQTTFIIFSSVNSVFGGPGSAIYSAANRLADSLAYHHRSRGGRAFALAWSMWDGVGLNKVYSGKEASQASGFVAIPHEQGWLSLCAALRQDQTHLIIGIDDANLSLRHTVVDDQAPAPILKAYVSTGDSGLLERIASEQQHDAFGKPVRCRYYRASKEALYETGIINRGKLRHERNTAEQLILPRTKLEEDILAIWKSVLKINDCGVEDDFFRSGGHSLLATSLVSKLQEAFGQEISLRALFESPTVAGLAKVVGQFQAKAAPTAVAVPRQRRPERLPLSFAQQRLWFFDQLEPGSASYNVSVALRIEGELNAQLLSSAVAEVVRRHEILRTTFTSSNGEPIQIVRQEREERMSITDLSGTVEEQRYEQARGIVEREARLPFDLKSGPLLRSHLVRLGALDHIFLLVVHHIVTDGWSMEIFGQEIAEIYDAGLKGRRPALPELQLQYADYAVEQRRQDGDVFDRQIAYWRERMKGAPREILLPTDRKRPLKPDYRAGTEAIHIGKQLTAGLRKISQECGASLFMTLLAGWQAFLSRCSGQSDVVVGIDITGRKSSQLEPLIGFFANHLPIRTEFSGDPGFRQIVGRVKESCLEAFAHQDVPFERLVEEMQAERAAGANPLFQVGLTLHNSSRESLPLPRVKVSAIDIKDSDTFLDLSLRFRDGDELAGELKYRRALFDPATVKQMISRFARLLESAVGNPESPINQLEIMERDEKNLLLVEWNQTQRLYPPGPCIHQQIEHQAEASPNATAVVFGGVTLTYSELNEMANAIGEALLSFGIGRGTLVPVLVNRGLELPIAELAVMKTGAAFVPIDSNWPEDRIARVVGELKHRVIVVDPTTKGNPAVADMDHILVDAAFGYRKKKNIEVVPDPEDPIYAIYTSGSTGIPKAAIIPHRGIINRFYWMNEYFGTAAAKVAIQTTPHLFDSSIWQLFWPLTQGGMTVIPLPLEPLTASSLARLIGLHKVTICDFVASVLTAMVPDVKSDQNVRRQLQSLRCIIVGSERIQPESVYQMMKEIPGARFFNLYGPTEASIGCICYEICGNEENVIPIGKPITNSKAFILDEFLKPVPCGSPGEIYISGTCVGLGYFNAPEKTGLAFLPNPYAQQGDGTIYKTGDIGRWRADGNIEYLGRRDDQVKVNGLRIELGEVEAALRSHGAVAQVVAIIDDASQEDKRLIAFIVYADKDKDMEISFQSWRSYLKPLLPVYMIPSAFVPVEAIPTAANGKVDRNALLLLTPTQWEPETLVLPRSNLELRLALIWESVFGKKPIGATDDFFELGGHSMLAVRLMARIEKEFGSALPLSVLFEERTIEGLAQALARQGVKSGPSSAAVAIQPSGSRTPLFFAHPIGGQVFGYYALARHLGEEQPFYGLQAASLIEPGVQEKSIKTMAGEYVDAIRRIQPYGPYLLGGYSFGGVVAFEIAQQLLAANETVDLLAILDTWSPVDSRKLAAITQDDASLLAALARMRAKEGAKELQLTRDDLVRYELDQQLHYILENLRRLKVIDEDIPDEQAITHIRNYVQAYKLRSKAFNAYEPGIYPGKITLFRCATVDAELSKAMDKAGIEPDESMGWSRHTRYSVDVHIVPGYHERMCEEPFVIELAARIKTCITSCVSLV